VVEGVVFAATRDGRLHAVDARSGKTLWGVATGADRALPWGHESGDLYLSSPTASGDLVLFGSGDGRLYALDRRSGKERWRVETGGRIRSTPSIANGRVFVGSGDGRRAHRR
jgi:outer membrane protein assembly factor BamB